MHIITGMVVAALMGKKIRGIGPSLPMSRTGPVRIAHALPGRTRFRVKGLSARGVDAGDLEARLAGIQGVDGARVDPCSGSVLVRHDEGKVGAPLLFAAIVRLIGAEDDLVRTPEPVVQRELRDVCGALDRAVYDRTGGLLDLKSALLIIFAFVGVQRVLRRPNMALPAGLSLVWWATNGLLR
jgi:hypothetical protein